MVYTDIRVTALSNDDMQEFFRLLQVIQQLGIEGANRKIEIHVDGDGSGSYSFSFLENDKKKQFPMIDNFDAENIKPIYLGE